MFDDALKIYLSYPAEMEYWWAALYDPDDDSEPEGPLGDLLALVAGEENDSFRAAVTATYERARKSFRKTIVDPVQDSLRAAAEERHLRLSNPRQREDISDDWAWNVRAHNGGQQGLQIGCHFGTQRCEDDSSYLYGHPWVWGRNQDTANALANILRGTFATPPAEGDWDRNTLCSASGPIEILPDSDPGDLVGKIDEQLGKALDGIARYIGRKERR